MTHMSPTPSVHRVRPAGPPTLAAHQLRAAQAATLAAPRLRYDPFSRLLFFSVDLLYGRKGSLKKFVVLEYLARIPYQAWEKVAYRAIARSEGRPALNTTTSSTTCSSSKTSYDAAGSGSVASDSGSCRASWAGPGTCSSGPCTSFARPGATGSTLPSRTTPNTNTCGLSPTTLSSTTSHSTAPPHWAMAASPPSPTCSARSVTTSASTSSKASPSHAPIGSPDPATTTRPPNRRRHSRHERLGDVRPPPTRGRPGDRLGPGAYAPRRRGGHVKPLPGRRHGGAACRPW